MTGPICSITGEPCECAAGSGCAATRRAAKTVRIAYQGARGVARTIGDAEARLAQDRPFPGPELREAGRLAAALMRELELIAEGLEE